MIKEAEENKEKDAKVKHERELVNRADSLISQLKQITSDEKFPAEQKANFEKEIEELTKYKDGGDYENLEKKLNEIETLLQQAAQFAAQQNTSSSPADDNVTEATVTDEKDSPKDKEQKNN